MVSRKAGSIMDSQRGAREAQVTTWAYMTLSVVLLLLGLSLAVFTSVGFVTISVWRAGVIATAVILVSLSVAVYFYKVRGSEGKKIIPNVDSERKNTRAREALYPYLFFLFGILLLINGVILLKPLGLEYSSIATVLTFSLLIIYVLLLMAFLNYFIHPERRKRMGKKGITTYLWILLAISISVLFLFISDTADIDVAMGYTLLILSLVWFLGSLLYDAVSRWKRTRGEDSRGETGIVMIALIASFFTASSIIARGDDPESYYIIAVVISVLWMAGAVIFFIKGYASVSSAIRKRRDLDLPTGSRLMSADDLKDRKRKKDKPLVSRLHYLVGTPDMIIEEEGYRIPVEIKSGRIPYKPHFSHVMQLGAYLILIDRNYDQDTPHGYIEYIPSEKEKKRFKVEWDMMTKALVLSKVSEIRDAESRNEAHRNHKREGKCRNCSRREGCPERLV